MCSHSKNQVLRLLFTIFLAIVCHGGILAQNTNQATVSVVVAPPFTNNFQDYLAPSKIRSTVQLLGTVPFDESRFDVGYAHIFLKGMLTYDGDRILTIRTKDNYIPSEPITVRGTLQLGLPNQYINYSPYTVTNSDIQTIFAANNLQYSGITQQELEQNGLPAGNYRLCIEVYHHKTSHVAGPILYGSGCASFTIQEVQPVINQTVQVLPPITNQLSDYFYGNKINSVITVVQYPQSTAKLKIRGYIKNSSGSIKIGTNSSPTVAPYHGITISKTGTSYSPYTLTSADYAAIFNEQFLQYIGITKAQVQQNGLPPDTYEMCFEIYEEGKYYEPLKTTCSAPFTIQPVQPIINQTVQVLPPYTRKLDDYLNTPGKINSVITVSQFASNQLNIKLSGEIRQTDGAVKIGNDGDSDLITITKTGAAFPPYTLTSTDIKSTFRYPVVEGMSQDEFHQNGLPYGTYELCFKMYDINRNDMLIGEFCSAPFTIQPVQSIINQTVQVLPPYTRKLDDYLNTSGKINSVITVSQYASNQLKIKLFGEIRQTDGAVRIGNDGYSDLITITKTGAAFPPYTLTSTDIKSTFRYPVVEGMSQDEFHQNGLPYGTYELCFKMYDINRNDMLIGEFCSAPFTIQPVQPIINQTVQVLPPITNKLSDYFSGTKINSVITVSQFPTNDAKLKVRGLIKSSDGSIEIGSNLSPAVGLHQITITKSGTAYPPRTLTASDYAAIFNEQLLVYKGITREQVQQNGLPAGTYEICFELYNEAQSELLKITCSAPFTIQEVQPIINQTVQVLPPITNKLSDYFSGTKINSVITVSQFPTNDAKLKVRGLIKSSDGSIEIGSNLSPAVGLHQITITKSGTAYPPRTLTASDYAAIFNEQLLVYKGITREQVQQNGLPAGTYEICFELYNEAQSELLKTTCSAPFTIQEVQPIINQTVQVLPPITNKLSDYFSGTKINSVITVSQFPTNDAKLKVRGLIKSSDGSIEIGSNLSPAVGLHQITITKSGTAYPPRTLTASDYAAIFNEQLLVYKGITREQVQQNGLPAGIYEICFELYNEAQSELLKTTCSTPFTIQDAQAVINQTIQVIPPFSNRLEDYTDKPGKINSVINVTQYPTNTVNIKLSGEIRSVDKSISIKNRGYSGPINIEKTGNAFLPYALTFADISSAFNKRTLAYTGISREQVEEIGLPDGNYEICFTIHEQSGKNLGTFCSAPFVIATGISAGFGIEPPIIIQPINEELITLEQRPALQFSWTRPAGAPANLNYKLKIIEVSDPGANYRDMLRNDAYPAFFETMINNNVPTYLYTPANPAFVEGRTYAFVVRALDPLGRTNFNNEGYSEIHTFTTNSSLAFSDEFVESADLKFLSPRDLKTGPDTLRTAYRNGFNLAWGWQKEVVRPDTTYSVQLVNARINELKKINKYILTVNEIDSVSGNSLKQLFTREFPTDPLSPYQFPEHIFVKKQEALNYGFEEKKFYKAHMQMIHENGQLVGTYQSNKFMVDYAMGDSANIRVKAVLDYEYEGFPAKYPLANTEVKVTVYSTFTPEGLQKHIEDSGDRFLHPSAQLPTLNTKTAQRSFFMTTDKDGRIERDITVSKRSLEDKEALFVTISIPNPYYNDKHFKTLRQKLNLTAYAQEKNKEITLDKEITQKAIDAIKGKSGSSNQNVESFENNDADFGQLTAKTNAYRLIVDVNKLYPKYDLIESKDKKTRKMELSKEKHGSDVNVTAYDVDMKKPINGLPMIIYRKKQTEVHSHIRRKHIF